MTLLILAYLGGVLTILSPCILPVLPFVLSRAGQPFLRSRLPLLAGMALTFAAVASLASAGGAWAVRANAYGRIGALALLAVFGLSLLLPRVAEMLARPVVALGNRLAGGSASGPASDSPWGSLLLGIATGLLWAPCAGPILGLVLTGAALHGASVSTSLSLAAYAAGAATSLAAALGLGGRVFALMKRSLGASQWLRRGLGAGVLGGVLAIGLGTDTGLLAQLSASGPVRLEQALVDALHKDRPAPQAANDANDTAGPGRRTDMLLAAHDTGVGFPGGLRVEGRLPPLDGAMQWLNSPPLSREQLQGKVTLVYFWTYSCINCIRTLPYLRAWADKYKDQGLTVVGVHTPEFAFEKSPDNVRRAVADFRIGFPVAVDSDYRIWRAFHNNYWPAAYFVDARGNIRHHQFGEGDYATSERVVQTLLAEAGHRAMTGDVVKPEAGGAQAAPDLRNVRSDETYIGYSQAVNFASPGAMRQDASRQYTVGKLLLNEWGLSGQWTIGPEQATLDRADGAIRYRFHARDLHLVLGPAANGRAVRFVVTIDGKPPGASHGADTDAGGNGAVTQTRLYQLVRQSGEVGEHTFEIRFLDPGAQAYAFTFG